MPLWGFEFDPTSKLSWKCKKEGMEHLSKKEGMERLSKKEGMEREQEEYYSIVNT